MNKTHNKGFIGFLLLLTVAVGASYFVKDAKGESYGVKGYKLAKYYFVERGDEAIEKAKGAQKQMQNHQNELQKMLE